MRNRKSLKYRVWHWFYHLEKHDFLAVIESISTVIAFIIFFALLMIAPHMFH